MPDVLKIWRERRSEMEIELTRESIDLIFLLTNSPGKAWKKEHWHPASKENADAVASRDVTSIARWLDERVLGKFAPKDTPEAKTAALLLCDRLKIIYDGGEGPIKDGDQQIPREQYREAIWAGIRNIFEREYKTGKHKIKKKYIERLQDLVKHYRGKPVEGSVTLTMQFADLDAALDGKPLPSASDVEGDD